MINLTTHKTNSWDSSSLLLTNPVIIGHAFSTQKSGFIHDILSLRYSKRSNNLLNPFSSTKDSTKDSTKPTKVNPSSIKNFVLWKKVLYSR